MKFSVAVFLSLTISTASANVLGLCPENFESTTSGKSVFIQMSFIRKFFAPWCGHCKSMAADWEKLALHFEGNETVLIAEVDCTDASNESICSAYSIDGFPTLKYGNSLALSDYTGSRDYKSLKEFAELNLKPSCDPFHLVLCEGEELTKIEGYFAMDIEELKSGIQVVDDRISLVEEGFEKSLEALQDKYMRMVEAHEEKLAEEKERSFYSTIKSVLAFKQKGGSYKNSMEIGSDGGSGTKGAGTDEL